MKKRGLFLFVVICISVMLSFFALMTVNADGTHGFFMTCDSDVVNSKSDGFMIDFYSDSENALCTYWSNANWSMYTGASIKKLKYYGLKGGGAYAGLQINDTSQMRKGIMSMWRYEYNDIITKETKYVYAKAIYGKTTTYDNEGSGTSCVMPYDWKSSRWYRELLLCWEDVETGYTFIGTWFYDYEEDCWTLFAYYNTFLVESYITGDVGQFLENYVESTRANYRSFRYRNIYFKSYENKEWVSSPVVNLRSDANPKAHGEAELGMSDDKTYVWAWVDGRSDKDTDELLQITARLVQNDKPEYSLPVVEGVTVNELANGFDISWKMTKNSTPQLSYNIVVTDDEGNELTSVTSTRPHITNHRIDELETDSYKVAITITDVFGQSVSAEYTSENYGKQDTTPTPDNSSTGTALTGTPEEVIPENTAGIDDNGIITVIIVSIAVIIIAGIIFTAAMAAKKKKK